MPSLFRDGLSPRLVGCFGPGFEAEDRPFTHSLHRALDAALVLQIELYAPQLLFSCFCLAPMSDAAQFPFQAAAKRSPQGRRWNARFPAPATADAGSTTVIDDTLKQRLLSASEAESPDSTHHKVIPSRSDGMAIEELTWPWPDVLGALHAGAQEATARV